MNPRQGWSFVLSIRSINLLQTTEVVAAIHAQTNQRVLFTFQNGSLVNTGNGTDDSLKENMMEWYALTSRIRRIYSIKSLAAVFHALP